MSEHPTRALQHPDSGEVVEIDVDLADLIAAMWAGGAGTVQCCQLDAAADSASIQFDSVLSAVRFTDLLFADSDDDDDLLERQRDWEIWAPEPSASRQGWRWKLAPTEHGGFDVAVEFPATDIAEVTRRVTSRIAAA